MPSNPFPIQVIIYDTDNVTLKSGASVYVRNITKGTTSNTVTTNSSGIAIIDISELTGTTPYETGDSVRIVAYYGTNTAYEDYTVSGESYDTILYLSAFTAVDPLETIKTLLDDNWIDVHTDSITPTVAKIVDVKTISMADGDYVLLYSMDSSITPFDIGATQWEFDRPVSIDVRTTYQKSEITDIRNHAVKMKEEVMRIIKSKVANPDSNHELLIPLRIKDLSDRSIGMGRFVVDILLKHWGS